MLVQRFRRANKVYYEKSKDGNVDHGKKVANDP